MASLGLACHSQSFKTELAFQPIASLECRINYTDGLVGQNQRVMASLSLACLSQSFKTEPACQSMASLECCINYTNCRGGQDQRVMASLSLACLSVLQDGASLPVYG